MDEWTESNLDIVMSDDYDLNERLEAAAVLGESDDEAIANALKELLLSQDGPCDLLVEVAASLALIWCRIDGFDPKYLIGLEDEECLRAIEEVFIPHRPDWVRYLPHMGNDWEPRRDDRWRDD